MPHTLHVVLVKLACSTHAGVQLYVSRTASRGISCRQHPVCRNTARRMRSSRQPALQRRVLHHLTQVQVQLREGSALRCGRLAQVPRRAPRAVQPGGRFSSRAAQRLRPRVPHARRAGRWIRCGTALIALPAGVPDRSQPEAVLAGGPARSRPACAQASGQQAAGLPGVSLDNLNAL